MAGLGDVLANLAPVIEGMILLDTVRIQLPAVGDPVLNEETGQLEYPAGQVLYEGPGAIQASAASTAATIPDAGQPWVAETASGYRLMTPLSAPVAPKDAIVSVLAVHNPADAALLGRFWIARNPGQATTLGVLRITSLDEQRAPLGGTP